MLKDRDSPKDRSGVTAARKPAALSKQPIALEAVVDAEAPAPKQTAESSLVGRLFRGDEAPTNFDLEDLPALAADNKNLAWVDLEQYSEKDLGRIAKLLDLHRLSAAPLRWSDPSIS